MSKQGPAKSRAHGYTLALGEKKRSVFIVTRYAPRSGGEVNTGGIKTGRNGSSSVKMARRGKFGVEAEKRGG
jgi:hypothetical protein